MVRLWFFATLFKLAFEVILAWALVRYCFAESGTLEAAGDLPFALPTALAGIALTALWAPIWALRALAANILRKIAQPQWNSFPALIFAGLPMVTRTVHGSERN